MMWSSARLEISGPLTPFAASFTGVVGYRGYAPATVRAHRRRMIHMTRWMQTAKSTPPVNWVPGGATDRRREAAAPVR